MCNRINCDANSASYKASKNIFCWLKACSPNWKSRTWEASKWSSDTLGGFALTDDLMMVSLLPVLLSVGKQSSNLHEVWERGITTAFDLLPSLLPQPFALLRSVIFAVQTIDEMMCDVRQVKLRKWKNPNHKNPSLDTWQHFLIKSHLWQFKCETSETEAIVCAAPNFQEDLHQMAFAVQTVQQMAFSPKKSQKGHVNCQFFVWSVCFLNNLSFEVQNRNKNVSNEHWTEIEWFSAVCEASCFNSTPQPPKNCPFLARSWPIFDRHFGFFQIWKPLVVLVWTFS